MSPYSRIPFIRTSRTDKTKLWHYQNISSGGWKNDGKEPKGTLCAEGNILYLDLVEGCMGEFLVKILLSYTLKISACYCMFMIAQ